MSFLTFAMAAVLLTLSWSQSGEAVLARNKPVNSPLRAAFMSADRRNARMNGIFGSSSSSDSEVEDDNANECKGWRKWLDDTGGDDFDAKKENKLTSHEHSRSYRTLDGDAEPYPDGIIPYEFKFTFPKNDKARVIGHWNELLAQINRDGMRGDVQRDKCVSIRERTEADDQALYVVPNNPEECTTDPIGFGYGFHTMNLGVPLCMNRNTIHHEFMHVLGFGHEHQRPDRDLYIKVREELRNTPDYQIDQNIKNMGFDYDFTSVMHYSQNKHPVKFLGKTIGCKHDMRMKKSILRSLSEDDPRKVFFYKWSPMRGANDLDIRKIRCFYKCNHKDDCPDEKPYPNAPVIAPVVDVPKNPYWHW